MSDFENQLDAITPEEWRLYQAAPDLLAALVSIVAILTDSGHDGDSPEIAVACSAAESLIDRARGELP